MKPLALLVLLLPTVPAHAQKVGKAPVNEATSIQTQCEGVGESNDNTLLFGYSNGNQTFECRNGKLVDTTRETWAELAKINKHRDELYFALRSRVLTAAEMEEVVALDWRITEHEALSGSYGPNYETEKRQQFNDALLQQFKLRIASEKAKIN